MPRSRHEALIFEPAVREQVHGAGGKEVGLAFEAQVLGNGGRAEAGRAHDAVVVRALARARRDQVREEEVSSRRAASRRRAAAGSLHWRDTRDPAGRDPPAARRRASRDRGACRAGAAIARRRDRGRRCAACRARCGCADWRRPYAEMRRIAHQHGAAPARHGSGIPGGSDAASKPPGVFEVGLRNGAVQRREDPCRPVVAAAATAAEREAGHSRRSCRGSS